MALRILLVEDDALFAETIEEFLSEEGYTIDIAHDVNEALEMIFYHDYDIYILDVQLPKQSGFDLLRQLRDQGDMTAALFLTSSKDRVKEGFLQGGDDYVVKPVDLEELLLRIKALLRRAIGEELIEIGEYQFDLKSLSLTKDGERVDLGLKELRLLELFAKNRGRNLSKEQIFDYLWGVDEYPSEGALRVYVNNLKKLFGKSSITNIRGFGYRFEK